MRPLAAQHVHRLRDLDAVADAEPQRRVHVGNQRDGAPSCAFADGDHRLRKRDGVVERLHERARARLDVEQNAVRAGGELLAHDRGRDQRDRVDRRRHIAQRVEFLVRRREVARLPDDGHAAFVHDGEEFFPRNCRLIAGDGLQFVHGTARVSETAAAHLCDAPTAGGDDRGADERRLVADAAGGVLVHLFAGNRREVDAVARVRHCNRQLRRLLRRHAAVPDCHQHGGHLVVGNLARDIAFDHPAQLLGSECAAMLFLRNQVIHAHGLILLSAQECAAAGSRPLSSAPHRTYPPPLRRSWRRSGTSRG